MFSVVVEIALIASENTLDITDPYSFTRPNNIHEKISPLDWLRAVQFFLFFSKTVQKRVNSVQKEETNQAF